MGKLHMPLKIIIVWVLAVFFSGGQHPAQPALEF